VFIYGIIFDYFQSLIALAPPMRLLLFAFLYSVGSLCSIGSTMFLMGPLKQLKKMFDPVRAVATIFFLFSVAMTILFACMVAQTYF
jgi:hypothetical protein